MRRRGKRRLSVWTTVATYRYGLDGILQFQVCEKGDRAHARIVEAGSWIVHWRQWVPLSSWRGCPRAKRESGAVSLLKRLSEMKGSGGRSGSGGLDQGAVRWPGLFELLTVEVMPDGSRRELSRLSLFLDTGCVKAGVTEPGMKASAFASGGNLEAALDALEARLQADDPDLWQVWRDGVPPWKRKGK